jgi:hypothetical protein
MRSRRTPYRRRGRAALLGAAALIVLAQLTAGMLLDWRGLAVRFPSAARVLAAAPRDGRGPDVVFLGSSRFEGLLADEATALLRLENPEAGPVRACNLAVPGGDPIVQDFVLEHLLRQGSRPRLALVEVSPDMVNHYNLWFNLHPHRQITWRDTPTYFRDVCRAGEFKKLAQSRLVPLYAQRHGLLREAARALGLPVSQPAHPPLPFDGASPPLGSDGHPLWDALLQVHRPPLSTTQAEAREAAAAVGWRRFHNYRPGGTTAAALERLLRRCRENGIEVVLIGAANDSHFRRHYTPDRDAAYYAYIGRLTRTYGCRFVDYRDAVPDQLFNDVCHLSGDGGHYLTRKLTREVLSPWLRQNDLGERRGVSPPVLTSPAG